MLATIRFSEKKQKLGMNTLTSFPSDDLFEVRELRKLFPRTCCFEDVCNRAAVLLKMIDLRAITNNS